MINKSKINKGLKDTSKTSENKASNPFDIIAKMNNFEASRTSNKTYSGYQNTDKISSSINEIDFISGINSILEDSNEVSQSFHNLHSLCVKCFNVGFCALGLLNDEGNCLSFRLIDKFMNIYSSRVFLNEESTIINCFNSGKNQICKNSECFHVPNLQNSSCVLFSLSSSSKTFGVLAFGVENAKYKMELLQLAANCTSILCRNKELEKKAIQTCDYDSLTGLYNHRKIQEILSFEINKAQNHDSTFSVAIVDINNLGNINKEYSHKKGDEIIRKIGNILQENIRQSDFIGRYAGDEFCIIFPNTKSNEAKYICEYISYNLSVQTFDDIGQIKISTGVSTYPEDAKEKEKLLILSEQAMYISKNRTYESGKSNVVSSSDYNFWDDNALKSYASVLAKRHCQMIGINFEEELVQRFHSEEISSNIHLFEVVTSLASAIDAKDEYTKGHSSSVSRYSEALARTLDLPESEVERIKLGALLHDVGKIGIPENILRKTDKLTDQEWEIMKQHPIIGAKKVLQPNSSLHDLIPIVKYHHERCDGKGYPDGLSKDEIPLHAKIVSIADAYHALISDRPYRKGMSVEKACEILQIGADIQWDKDLIRKFIEIAPALATKI